MKSEPMFEPGAVGLRHRFRTGATWNLVGSVLGHGANFLTNVIIANLLGREIFGEFGIVQSTAMTSAGVAMIATGITATKYVAEFRIREKQKAGRILGLCSVVTAITGSIATLVVWFFADWIARVALKSPHLTESIRIGAALIFFSVINGYQIGALSGLESFRSLAWAYGTQGIIQLAVCGVCTWRWGLNGALFGMLITTIGRWLVFHFTLRAEGMRQGVIVAYNALLAEKSVLFKFAIPAAISGMTVAPAIWIGNALLMRQTDGASDVALFNAAYSLKSAVVFLPWVLNSVGMAILNSHRGEENRKHYRESFWINLVMIGTCAAVGAILVAGAGPVLLRLYGRKFIPGYSTLLALMFAVVAETVALGIHQLVITQERMWLSFFCVALPKDMSLVAAAYCLVPLHRAFGLGLSHAISSAVYLTTIGLITFWFGLDIGNKPHLMLQADVAASSYHS